MEAIEIDFNGFREKFPGRPQEWSVVQMCNFLKGYALAQFVPTFGNISFFY